MEFIANIDWVTVFAYWGAFVAFASAIVKLTPTMKDDAILEKVLKFVELFSVFSRK
ncbi:hypothetical protein [Caudoviricetes sp.]|nr:hypothetical protein [Caudoviricetes sp.]